ARGPPHAARGARDRPPRRPWRAPTCRRPRARAPARTRRPGGAPRSSRSRPAPSPSRPCCSRCTPRRGAPSRTRGERSARAEPPSRPEDLESALAGLLVGLELVVPLLDGAVDVHRAELRPAHRAELGGLEVLVGESRVVHRLRGLRVEREAEL